MTTIEPDTLPKLFIREWAKHKGFGQKHLAERMGTTEATVSRLLSGQRKMTLEWLSAFSQAMDCDASEMFRAPEAADGPIRGERAIYDTLKRIEGLSDYNVSVVLSIIMNALKAQSSEREQSRSDDQPAPATDRHEVKP